IARHGRTAGRERRHERAARTPRGPGADREGASILESGARELTRSGRARLRTGMLPVVSSVMLGYVVVSPGSMLVRPGDRGRSWYAPEGHGKEGHDFCQRGHADRKSVV